MFFLLGPRMHDISDTGPKDKAAPRRSALPERSSQAGSIRYAVHPRDVPSQKAARRLHLTLAEFDLVREELFARGFPRPDPTTGMYDLKAIAAWQDRRSPLTDLTPSDSARDAAEVFGDRLDRLRHGQ